MGTEKRVVKNDEITISDIARKLKLSVSTVSRALNGKGEVNPDTREAVIKMAKDLHYQPNSIAQNMRSSKTRTLGLIVPDLVPHFFSASITGIQEVAYNMGYYVLICQSNESLETEVRNLHAFSTHRVDGLLMSLSKETASFEHLEALYAKKNSPGLF